MSEEWPRPGPLSWQPRTKTPRSDGPGPSPAHKRDYDWQFPEDHMGTKEPVATGSEEPASSKSKCEPRLEGMNDDL